MESLLPVVVAVAALGLMYLMCIRPMRRGHCGMMPQQHASDIDTQREDEIVRLRAEIAELRQSQEASHAAGEASSDAATGDSSRPR